MDWFYVNNGYNGCHDSVFVDHIERDRLRCFWGLNVFLKLWSHQNKVHQPRVLFSE